jgi:outer membrane phospholipase A
LFKHIQDLARFLTLILCLAVGFQARAQEESFHDGAPEVSPLLVRLEHYKPIYFIIGNPDAKVQFSFKFKVLDQGNLYFGYSQLMMWDMTERSAPIRDTDYNPDIFYRWVFDDQDKQSQTWLDFGFWEHESNGKDDKALGSRSWDRSYLRFRSVANIGYKDTKVYWSIKAWAPYRMDSENRDISKYRGLWELNVSVANLFSDNFKPDDMTLRLYPGGKSSMDPTAGGEELMIRMRPYFRTFLREAVIQIFHGYGEDLLEYDQNRWGIRAGIGF